MCLPSRNGFNLPSTRVSKIAISTHEEVLSSKGARLCEGGYTEGKESSELWAEERLPKGQTGGSSVLNRTYSTFTAFGHRH
jgi:hypothetical protein